MRRLRRRLVSCIATVGPTCADSLFVCTAVLASGGGLTEIDNERTFVDDEISSFFFDPKKPLSDRKLDEVSSQQVSSANHSCSLVR